MRHAAAWNASLSVLPHIFHLVQPTLLPRPAFGPQLSFTGPLTLLSVLSLLGWSSSTEHEGGKLSRATVKMKPVAGRGFWEGLMEQGAKAQGVPGNRH